MPEFLEPLFGNSPRATAILLGVLAVLGLLALILVWQIFGSGPRRRRGLNRAKKRLAEGAWEDALARVRKLRNRGKASSGLQKRLTETEAECLRTGATLALKDKKFEEALGHFLHVAQLLGEPEIEAKVAVQAAMLEEIRRLFSVTTLGDNKAVHDLIERALLVHSPCREASFWQALCFLRGGEPDRTLESLQTARTGEAKTLVLDDGLGEMPGTKPVSPSTSIMIDPPLYLGALLLRQGLAKDSLKYLTEANRIDGNCPVVTLQLGSAMIAAGGDTQLAVRALQRALGPRGLEMWAQEPRKAWVEGFPESRSFIRKLASAYPFVCPLWGGDLNILMQQGNLALAQGLYKMAAYQEAADLFGKVLQNGAPSLTVLRGLGLSLAKLGKYDDAFKHLRIAHEMEEPKDRVTAGYLALCGAKGKPTEAHDKARNILWALKVVTRFNAPGDREWIGLISDLFSEARLQGEKEPDLTLSRDDQLYLCEHLLSVRACDTQAAWAYHQLQATYPQTMLPEYAWLFCRADQQQKVEGAHSLDLYALTFANPEPARTFFEEQSWDFSEVEFTFLERSAALDPGHFPKALGPDYASHGEEFLLARSHKQEQADQGDRALATAEILRQLAPHSPHAFDRLAFLNHKLGHADRAEQLLEAWSKQDTYDPRPIVRRAVLMHQRGSLSDCQTTLGEALKLCSGTQRAKIAFLGAKLTLQSALLPGSSESNGTTGLDGVALRTAEVFLNQCLEFDPIHADALWCLAAVRWLAGDVNELARQAGAMTHPEVKDLRYQFFAALCRLAALDFAGVLEICNRRMTIPPLESGVSWPLEIAYLTGLAHLGLGQNGEASQELEKAALVKESPSSAHAQALLGSIGIQDDDYQKAGKWWQSLDPKKRLAWKVNESLSQTVFLTALEAYARGSFEEAAEKLRSAGRLGCRDRRLGPILVMSLFKAGQAVIYAVPKD